MGLFERRGGTDGEGGGLPEHRTRSVTAGTAPIRTTRATEESADLLARLLVEQQETNRLLRELLARGGPPAAAPGYGPPRHGG